MGGRPHSAGAVARDLDRTICRLTSEHGHANLLTYPWRLYLAAIAVANEGADRK